MKILRIAAATLIAGAAMFGTTHAATAADNFSPEERELINQGKKFRAYADSATCKDFMIPKKVDIFSNADPKKMTVAQVRSEYSRQVSEILKNPKSNISQAAKEAIKREIRYGFNVTANKSITCGFLQGTPIPIDPYLIDQPADSGSGFGGSSFSS